MGVSTAPGQARAPPGGCSTPRWRCPRRIGHFNMSVDTTAASPCVAAAEGARRRGGRALPRAARALGAQRGSPLRLRGLRWSRGVPRAARPPSGRTRLRRGADAIASDTGHADALAALAHAIGETALLEGDAETAAEQLARAVELHRGLDVPFERARSSCARASRWPPPASASPRWSGWPTPTAPRASSVARPLAAEAAREVAALGDSVRRLGRPAAADAEGAGLTRRELEVVRLVAVGRTNREIAAGALPQPAHRRHARPQHPPQARLPLARRGRPPRR